MIQSRRFVCLLERYGGEFSSKRVDWDNGIIHNVKILGFTSRNKRRYLREAVQKAIPLYESVAVNLHHPTRATDARGFHELVGCLRNVHVEEDGLFGDLHLLTSKKIASEVMEAAEKTPHLLGLSHNADGETRNARDGTLLVEAITEVRSVDIVRNAATTNGLFESVKGDKTMKFSALLEHYSTDNRLAKKVRKRLLEMPEDDMPAVDVPSPAPESSADDPMAALHDGFAAALSALASDLSIPFNERKKKVIALMKHHEGVMSDDPANAGGDDSDEDDSDDDDSDDVESLEEGKTMKPKKMTESYAERIVKLAGLSPAKQLLEALCEMEESKALGHVEWLVEQKPVKVESSPDRKRPRSSSGSIMESQRVSTDDVEKAEKLYRNGLTRIFGRAATEN